VIVLTVLANSIERFRACWLTGGSDTFEVTPDEFDVVHPGSDGVPTGELEQLRGHVGANHLRRG